MKCVAQMRGRLHIVRGNHDTDRKWEMYKELPNVVELCGWATMIKYKKYHFYLSHFPTMTPNIGKESLKETVINLFGHTHQQTRFYNGIAQMYHVGIDTHNNYPILLDNIIEDIKFVFY
jgi:calcineurin-like phosphoesterase family protein